MLETPKKIPLILSISLLIVLILIFVLPWAFLYGKQFSEAKIRQKMYDTEERSYHDYEENCDWRMLKAILENQALAFSSDNSYKNIEQIAKTLVGRGIKPCTLVSKQEFDYATPDEKFWFKGVSPVIDNHYIVEYQTLYKVHNTLYSGVARQIKEPANQADGSVRYEWSRDEYILLLTDIQSGIPKILKKYSIKAAEDTTGPYYIPITRTKWLVFNSSLTVCKFIALEITDSNYRFIETKCQFDNLGNLEWE